MSVAAYQPLFLAVRKSRGILVYYKITLNLLKVAYPEAVSWSISASCNVY